jgi:Sigma-70 region 2
VSEETPDQALARIVQAATTAEGSVDRDDLLFVVAVTERWLSRRVADQQIRHDAAIEAFYRFVQAARDGTFADGRPVGAWLRVVAQRIAIDLLRRRQHLVADQPLLLSATAADDEIARLLDGVDSAERIRLALKAAVDAGDYETVRIITTWLDVAANEGGAPASRYVADHARVSHMSVQRAIQRFARYVDVARRSA